MMKKVFFMSIVMILVMSCTNDNCNSEFEKEYINCLSTISKYNDIRGELSDEEIRGFFYSADFLYSSSGISSSISMDPPIYNHVFWQIDSVNYMNWLDEEGCNISKKFSDSLKVTLRKEWEIHDIER